MIELLPPSPPAEEAARSPFLMCTVTERPVEIATRAVFLLSQDAAGNHLRIVARGARCPPDRSATAAFPNDNHPVLDIKPAADY